MRIEKQSFENVYDDNFERVFRLVAKYTPNLDEAHDLTQEVFIRAYKAYDSFRGDSNVWTWLYRIARNTCIESARSHARRPEYLVPDTDLLRAEDVGCDVLSDLLDSEEKMHLLRSLRCLSPDQILVFSLRFIEQLKLCEIAEIVGAPIETVQARLRRGIEKIKHNISNPEAYTSDKHSDVDPSSLLAGSIPLAPEKCAKVYHSLGSLYLKKGLIEAAFREWSRATMSDPAFLDPYMSAANQFIKQSEPWKAVDTLEQAVVKIRNANLHTTLAGLYLGEADYPEAVYHCNTAVDLEPQNAEAHFIAGCVYYRQAYMHDYKRAVLALAPADWNDPVKGWHKAKELLEKSVALRPDHARSRAHLSYACYQTGRIDEAVHSTETALELGSDDAPVLYQAGWLHQQLGQLEQAESYMRKCLSCCEESTAYWCLGSILLHQDRSGEALQTIKNAFKFETRGDTKSHLRAYAAVIANRAGEYDEAIRLSEEALKYDPLEMDARGELVQALLKKHVNPSYIEKVCREGLALAIHGNHKNLNYLLAQALFRQKRLDDALEQASIAVETRPDKPSRWRLRALILIKLKRPDEAKQDLLKVIELSSEDKKAKSLLNYVSRLLGEQEAA